jgi:hypothetical protein
MGRVTVAWEGRNTLDGRVFELESLSPRSERLPIFYNFSYTTALGWAEEFGRFLNPETGWGELSFELYFKEDWEAKLRQLKLIPTISMTTKVGRRTPYDQPENITSKVDYITEGEILCVSFGQGLSAWGDTGPW